jgi:cytoskeletal protein RodZ
MAGFHLKPVSQKTLSLGEELTLARARKGLKLDRIAHRLNIKAEYLQALETENYHLLPQGLYIKSFLKKYSNYLGLNTKKILETFDQEHYNRALPVGNTFGKSNIFEKKIVKKNKLIIFPKVARNLVIIIIALACLLYLAFYLKKIFTPPKLEIYSPVENVISSSSSVIVAGKTEKESQIQINGQDILIDNSGNFSQEVNLKKGLNSIIIETKKKYSREMIITRQILVE